MKIRVSGLLAVAAFACGGAAAQSVANGNTLYHSICVSCHGDPPRGGQSAVHITFQRTCRRFLVQRQGTPSSRSS